MRRNTLSLYIHIPFCVKKCNYCDFLSMPADEKTQRKYVEMLLKEIKQEGTFYQDYRVNTVFFGGGTPTALKTDWLIEILKAVRESFCFCNADGGGSGFREAEITIECNPGTVEFEDLCELRKAGFNRLSIGLQSADNGELALLGRIHTWETFFKTYENARKAGFDNINIDLMSALPGQTLLSYQQTLEKVLTLEPEHISAYSLIIEEGTPFYEIYGEENIDAENPPVNQLPDEETERAMYDLTEKLLMEKGYFRYEISNYAKKGKECRHNIVYWQRGNYLGLGLGSASLVDNVRFHKEDELEFYLKYMGRLKEEETGYEFQQQKYLSGAYQEQNVLSEKEQMEEFMFLGLRMMDGVKKADFRQQFQKDMDVLYGKVLQRLEKQGMIKQTQDTVMLTARGIDVSNVVLAEFLL